MSSVIFFNSQETAGEPIGCPNCRKKLNREQVSLDRLIFECITLIWWKIIEHLHNCKQVISRRGKNENGFKMSKNEKCTCKACKPSAFHCQICDVFVADVVMVAQAPYL